MAGFEFDTSGFSASLDRLITTLDMATRDATNQGAALIEGMAKTNFGSAHKKGSPKTDSSRPQSVTGTLRRSIRSTPAISTGPGIWTSTVAPTEIYGRRIELGFHGTDSLGRDYSNPGQPPYPYLSPAVNKAENALSSLFSAAWNAALQG